ncbi:MAG: ABC transporter permease [Chloroflexi bacterium]|nr:MAG: ABC transporter permease [Chloroflexota bacterium]
MSMTRRLLQGLDNPIVVKEGVSRMRTWRAPVVATLYLSLIGAVGYAWLNVDIGVTQQSFGAVSASAIGSHAFAAMAFFQLTLISLFAPALAAGAVSGERERQTLDVLLVSRGSAFGIIWGKLVASMAYTLLLILTALPLFAAVFLFGGIDPSQFFVSQLITVATAIALGAISIFWSTLFKRSLAATVMSYVSAFGLMVGTAVLSTMLMAAQFTAGRSGLVATTGAQTPGLPALWYLNPFFSLYEVLFPQGYAWPTLRTFLQLLIFGPGAGGYTPIGGPVVEPWHATIVAEGLVAIACTIASVWLLRGRRTRPRRRLEPLAQEPA